MKKLVTKFTIILGAICVVGFITSCSIRFDSSTHAEIDMEDTFYKEALNKRLEDEMLQDAKDELEELNKREEKPN